MGAQQQARTAQAKSKQQTRRDPRALNTRHGSVLRCAAEPESSAPELIPQAGCTGSGAWPYPQAQPRPGQKSLSLRVNDVWISRGGRTRQGQYNCLAQPGFKCLQKHGQHEVLRTSCEPPALSLHVPLCARRTAALSDVGCLTCFPVLFLFPALLPAPQCCCLSLHYLLSSAVAQCHLHHLPAKHFSIYWQRSSASVRGNHPLHSRA